MSEQNNYQTDIKYIRRDLDEIKDLMKEQRETYVTKDEFRPVKTLVYGVVSLILVGVMSALIALVIKV
jgi:ABC-type phosphate transport system permease subunit